MNIGMARTVCLAAALLLLTFTVIGCATTLGTTLIYNHADWWMTRHLDGYFDLSRSQKQFVSNRLSAILDHHRHDALPRYEDVIRQARGRIERGLTRDDLDWTFGQYDRLKADLLARFVGDGAEFIGMVETPQLARVRKGLEKRLAKQERLLRESREARLAAQSERLVTLAKEWLGPMTRQQERELTDLAMAFPDTLPALYAHERQRNERMMAVLEARADGDATKRRLYESLIELDKHADPDFTEAVGQLRQHLAGFILALDRLATPQQRRHVLARLDDLAHTIHDLRGA